MTDDFGRCLEAAISAEIAGGGSSYVLAALARFRDAVRAANAQCSAPALAPHMFPVPSNEGAGVAGAGADLTLALNDLRRAASDAHGWCQCEAEDARALLSHIESLERDATKYAELIYAVERKYDGETRHQTALRYIRQAEVVNAIDAARKEGK